MVGTVVALTAVLVPALALASTGSFSSSSATPAVRAVNSSLGGTGVSGSGALGVLGTSTTLGIGVKGESSTTKKGGTDLGVGVEGVGGAYGVYSRGNLGVATGRQLMCTGCVTPGDLSSLPSGDTESGVFLAAGFDSSASEPGVAGAALQYQIPLASSIPISNVWDTEAKGTSDNCPAPGSAAAGWLCLYGDEYLDLGNITLVVSHPQGVEIFWALPAGGAGGADSSYYAGTWTVTAP